MKKVMIFGTFDYVHPGHFDLFRQAKKYGDYLVAIVARDETVKKVKGRKPKFDEQVRLHDVEENPLIDHARLGYKDSQYRVIIEEKPDVICLGYDQEAFTEKLEDLISQESFKTKIVRLKSHNPEKFKSSKFK